MVKVRNWLGLVTMSVGLLTFACGSGEPESGSRNAEDKKEIHAVSQPIYGGNTVVVNTPTGGAIGATANIASTAAPRVAPAFSSRLLKS